MYILHYNVEHAVWQFQNLILSQFFYKLCNCSAMRQISETNASCLHVSRFSIQPTIAYASLANFLHSWQSHIQVSQSLRNPGWDTDLPPDLKWSWLEMPLLITLFLQHPHFLQRLLLRLDHAIAPCVKFRILPLAFRMRHHIRYGPAHPLVKADIRAKAWHQFL